MDEICAEYRLRFFHDYSIRLRVIVCNKDVQRSFSEAGRALVVSFFRRFSFQSRSRFEGMIRF